MASLIRCESLARRSDCLLIAFDSPLDGVPHQVRELGEALGLPTALVWRQPFPGPGLAIRVLCADAPYITPDFDAVQAKLVAECAACSVLPVKPVLLPVRTVGVQGDGRSYSYLAALTMAHSPHGSWPQLLELAQLLPTKVHQVNRVCFLMGAPLEESPREITPTCLYSTNGFAQPTRSSTTCCSSMGYCARSHRCQ